MKISKFVRLVTVVSCFATCLAMTTAWAEGDKSQDRGGQQTQDKQSMQSMQRQWSKEMALNQLHHVNQKEIEMTKMAQDKAQSPELKNFAKQMQTDHTNLDNRIKDVAKTSNVELQKFQPADYEKATMSRLGDLKSGQFDQMFTWTMVRGHEDALADLKRTSDTVQDQQVRSLIQEAMPRMRQHLDMARTMSQSISRGVASDQQQQQTQDQNQ